MPGAALRRDLQQWFAFGPGPCGRLSAGGETQFAQDALDVPLSGAGRDDQPCSDLLVAHALCEKVDDLVLAGRQGGRAVLDGHVRAGLGTAQSVVDCLLCRPCGAVAEEGGVTVFAQPGAQSRFALGAVTEQMTDAGERGADDLPRVLCGSQEFSCFRGVAVSSGPGEYFQALCDGEPVEGRVAGAQAFPQD